MGQPVKTETYEVILAELGEAFGEAMDRRARMATAAALLHLRFTHFYWTGFFLLVDGRLIVGPYQGPPAPIVLEERRGVCWAGIERGQPVVVKDVHRFPGYIAGDGHANSEVVVPMRDADEQIIGVLDVQSGDFDAFDEVDVEYLDAVVQTISSE